MLERTEKGAQVSERLSEVGTGACRENTEWKKGKKSDNLERSRLKKECKE